MARRPTVSTVRAPSVRPLSVRWYRPTRVWGQFAAPALHSLAADAADDRRSPTSSPINRGTNVAGCSARDRSKFLIVGASAAVDTGVPSKPKAAAKKATTPKLSTERSLAEPQGGRQ